MQGYKLDLQLARLGLGREKTKVMHRDGVMMSDCKSKRTIQL